MKKSLLCVLALAASSACFAQRSATLDWTAVTTYADGTPIAPAVVTYGIYQGLQGQPKTKVATAATNTATISSGLAQGTVVCWQVSAIANAKESTLSNEACKTFPQEAPSPPTNLTVR